MPLYEYQCLDCKTHFEKIQKFSDPPLQKCEKCGGKLERLISSPAIQFKGTGWYVTDYAKKSSGGEGRDSKTKEQGSKSSNNAGASDAKPSASSKPAETTSSTK